MNKPWNLQLRHFFCNFFIYLRHFRLGDVNDGNFNSSKMFNKDSMPDFMSIVGYAVAFLFVIFGLYIMLTPQIANSLSPEFRTIFGVVIIGYGIFRMVIIYQKGKHRKYSDDESDN
jgi:hypothetical protein